MFSIFCLLTMLLFENTVAIQSSKSNCNYSYVVVIDAGSSGTRLHVFQFEKSGNHSKLIKTNRFSSPDAVSKYSSLRSDWDNLRLMIESLIKNARTIVDDECIQQTPIYLQATAGVRQIDIQMSLLILKHLREILRSTKFKFEDSFVSILDTPQEGRLAWVSVNFLLDKLQHSEGKTIGSLDLGGGSTQIAFQTDREELLQKTAIVRVFGKNYKVYCGGYDYKGINEARIQFVNANNCFNDICKGKIMRSTCINPGVVQDFRFGNRSITVGGKISDKYQRFCRCYQRALKLIENINNIRQFVGDKQFLGMSAYYYILHSAGILKYDTNDIYTVEIRSIILKSIQTCTNPPLASKNPSFDHFQCIDLSYVVGLLHNGYGFEWYDKLKIAKKIGGINLSWALGFAITKL